MLSIKSILRISLAFGVLSWILFVVADIAYTFLLLENNGDTIIPIFIPRILFDTFVVSVFVYYRYSVGRAESVNFIDLLWRVFVTGLLTTVVSLVLHSILLLFSDNRISEALVLLKFFYHVNVGLIVAFLISTFVVWKRLILYQKTKWLILLWKIFQYGLLASLALNLFQYGQEQMVSYVVIGLLMVNALILSVNLKWIAYLNFRQKWKSILFILLVMIYLGYFVVNLTGYNSVHTTINLLTNPFTFSLFGFIFLYSVFSLLVILFNLPTSSVFEQKIEEAMNFQRLSQSIPTGANEEEVYDILLDSSISAVFADAAWLEVENELDNLQQRIKKGTDDIEVDEVRNALRESSLTELFSAWKEQKNLNPMKLTASLSKGKYKSVMVVPMYIQQKKFGHLVLLKELGDGFNKEMVDIIKTFVNQASISVENFRLLKSALENERYKEELKIAKRVQRSLLPSELEDNDTFQVVGVSEAADEVGGDYYDTYRIDEHRFALIIGDVSGKGTSAAFNMSQMKGVFHSLAQMDMGPLEFLVRANTALSLCLEKTSFITASYFIIDTLDRSLEFARAGHCPTLYYNSESKQTQYFKNKGLGLGILRNTNFHRYVQTNKFFFQSQDLIVLYTDGIIEAKNHDEEEYGYDRLEAVLQKHCEESPEVIQQAIIDSLFEFLEDEHLNDDYTLLIIRFK